MCAALHPHNFHPLTTSSGVFVGFFESMYEQLKRHSGLIDQLLAAEEQRRSPMSHSDSIYIVTSKPDAPGAYETAEQKRHQIFERELAEHQHEPGALNAQQPNEIRMNDKQVGGTRATDTAYSRGIDMGLPVGISIQIAAQLLGPNPNVRVERGGQRTSAVPCGGAHEKVRSSTQLPWIVGELGLNCVRSCCW